MIRAVIFDNDGVIVDSHATFFNVFKEQIKHYFDAEYSLDEFKQYGGLRYEEVIMRLLKERGIEVDMDKLDQMVDEGREKYFMEGYKFVPLHEGVIDLIKELKTQSFKVGLGTNGGRETLMKILKHNDIEKYFDAIVTYSDASRAKPYPDIFELCATKMDINPKACVVIEDTDTGLCAAKKAGMKAIAVKTTLDEDRLDQADKIFESIKDITVDDIRQLA